MSEPGEDDAAAGSTRASPWRIALRVVLVVAALAVSAFVVATAFDDLDPAEVAGALRSLSDAETISLLAMWLIWLASQGLQTASLIPRLPVRRGVVAFLGPAAVASVIPGPSDLPVRYRMLTSWGVERSEATLAVAAGGVFSIGIKLVLPIIAAIGLLVSDRGLEGPLRTVVGVALLVGLVLAAIVAVLSSASRTATVGRWLDPVWRALLKRMRRADPVDLAPRLLAARARSLDVLRERWPIATWAAFLTGAARFALLLMALRFTGVPEEALGWTEVFVVYALVQGLTVLPLTPGDAGTSEIAYIGLLTAAAGSELVNEVTAAVILFRLLTWLIIIPVGVGALAVWKRSTART